MLSADVGLEPTGRTLERRRRASARRASARAPRIARESYDSSHRGRGRRRDARAMALQVAAQVLDLLWRALGAAAVAVCGVALAALSPMTWLGVDDGDGARFYVGEVAHARLKPVRREFKYPLRCAVVDLDAPPRWFAASGQARDHLTADEARERVGLTGAVELLTSPKSFGYAQNPISVYYCRDDAGELRAALAEVTNTPWNERVVFAFDPTPVSNENEATVPKALHVSPFMDMEGEWYVSSTAPGDDVTLRVNVLNHPRYGDYFYASFKAKLDKGRYVRCRNERAGLVNLLKHGCTPHRVAYWIYAQAVAILLAGVSFYAPPGLSNVETRVRAKGDRGGMCPMRPTFRGAPYWPWRT